MAKALRLGLNLGYWAAGPPPGAVEAVAEAERLGFDSLWTAEAYGSDALTPLAWWGAATEQIKLGTSIVQISARTPAATAMAAMTLDHLSGGRMILGLGVSGPQVVEGWYGQSFAKPLARTREYISVLRDIWARQGPVTNPGPHYPLPRPGGTGLGKSLKSSIHPLRDEIPIYLAAEGPKNIALAGELCDGWLPLFYSPYHDGFYRQALHDGFARAGARHAADSFEVAATVPMIVTDDVEVVADIAPADVRPVLRRDGGAGDQLPRQRRDPDGLRGRGGQDPGALPGRPQAGRGCGGADGDDRADDADRAPRTRSATNSTPGGTRSSPRC